MLYHGSLAGLVPGGPGHSHQSVRDIALMGSVPGMAALEPYCEAEVRRGGRRGPCASADGPVYLRFVSPPWPLGFEPPDARSSSRAAAPSCARARTGTFVCTGPVLVSQAWARLRAARRLGPDRAPVAARRSTARGSPRSPHGRRSSASTTTSSPGGQGEAVLRALAAAAPEAAARTRLVGVDRVPECGTNDEVLRAHGLDAESTRRALRGRSLPA